MFWRRARSQTIHADLSGHFERTAIAFGDYAVANTYNGTVIQRFAADTAPSPTRRPPPQRRPPRDPVEILGREPELRLVATTMRSASAMVFHGSAGVGKTALLKHVAGKSSAGRPDGVLFANVAAQPLEDVLQWLFTVFWDTGPVVYAPGALKVGEYLADVQALVVLDDVELSADDMERLVDRAPACAFVLGAADHCLPGRSHALHGVDGATARQLFTRVLGRAPQDAERQALDAFVAAVEGLPGYIVTGAECVRDGICRVKELIEQPAAALVRRRLAALPVEQRALLALLAELAPAPVPADRLALGAEDQLERLRAGAFVERHSPRYTLVGPLDAETAKSPELSDPRELLLGLAEMSGPIKPDDAPSITAALDWGERTGEHELVLRVARTLIPATVGIGRAGAWTAIAGAGHRAARHLGRPAEEALFLHERGTALGCLGDAAARAALTQARDIRQRLDDQDGSAVTEHNLRELFGGAGAPPLSNGGGGGRFPGGRALLTTLAVLGLALVATFVAFGGGDDKHDSSSTIADATTTPTTSQPKVHTTPAGTTTTATNPGANDRTPPTIELRRPRNDERIAAGARVTADYRCSDRGRAAPICVGTVRSGAALDTSIGDHRFRVHARDEAGNRTDTTATYHVGQGSGGPKPQITITSPADGSTVPFGMRVRARYQCSDASTCEGGVANGVPVDGRVGTHDFTVTATGTDGASVQRTVTYSVEAVEDPLTVNAVAVPIRDGQAFTLQATCSGGTPPLSCEATLGDKPIDDGAVLPCGDRVVVVHATDAAGQTEKQPFPLQGATCQRTTTTTTP